MPELSEFRDLEINDRFTVQDGQAYYKWVTRRIWIRQNWEKWVDDEYKYNAITEEGRDTLYFKPLDRVVKLDEPYK